MDSRKLQDRIEYGYGRAALHIGETASAYRPKGPMHPLAGENRFLRLPAVFVPAKGGMAATNFYGDPLWHGIFDSKYTLPGDYLVTERQILFVASQQPLLPVLCVLTNRTISIVRPSIQTAPGGNPYGGFATGNTQPLLERWPASVLGENRSSASATDLPTDQTVPYWNILLPAASGVLISPGDRVTDDIGRSAVVSGSESTHLGWRLTAKMATT